MTHFTRVVLYRERLENTYKVNMKDTDLRVSGFGNTLSEKFFEFAKVCITFEAPLIELVERSSQRWWSDRDKHELDAPRLL
jgi:hypothetical protein